MSPAGLRARAVDYFVEPRDPPPPREASAGSELPGYRAPLAASPVPRAAVRAATRLPLRGAVLGSAGEAVPVAAVLANALRAVAGASTGAVAVWTPGSGAPLRGGPASFAASRLAARLTARGLSAVARGRLAWLRLEDHPVAAAVAARRAAGALEVPLVTVLGGPRCDVIEALLGEQDLVLVVAADPDGPLARLAVGSCTAAALAHGPCPPGPARWLALAGLGGARGLGVPVRALVSELATAPAFSAEETW